MHFDVQYKERAFSNAWEIFRPALQCLGNLQTSNSRFQGLKEKKNYASITFTKTVQDPQATPGKCEKKKMRAIYCDQPLNPKQPGNHRLQRSQILWQLPCFQRSAIG